MKLSELPTNTNLSTDDLIYCVDDAAGTPQSRKTTIAAVLGLLDMTQLVATSPATSTRNVVTAGSSGVVPFIVKGAASQGANLTEWQNSSSVVGARITSNRNFSNAGGQFAAEIFGANASVTGSSGTAVGSSATAASSGVALGATATAGATAVAVGNSATAPGNSVIIGNLASTTGSNAVAVGASAVAGHVSVTVGTNATGGSGDVVVGCSTTGGGESVCIGNSQQNVGSTSIVLGYLANSKSNGNIILMGRRPEANGTNRFIAGSSLAIISDVFFGKGDISATPTAYTINGTGGSGTDIGGAALRLAGGRGTGTGVGGSVIFQTSAVGTTGSTLQTLVDRLTINNSGNVLVNGFTSSTVGLTVRGAAGQTANLQEWQNSSSTVLASVSSGGVINTTTNVLISGGGSLGNGRLEIQTGASTGHTFIHCQNNSGVLHAVNGHVGNGLVGVGTSGLTNTMLGVRSLATNAVGIAVRAIANMTANLQEWQNSSGTVLSTVSENGYLTTRINTGPADAELAAGEAAYWFDSTNGAAKLMIKAKQADGTVVTGSVTLT